MQTTFLLLSSAYRSCRTWLLGVGLLMSLLSSAQTIRYVTTSGPASASAAVSWASSTTDLQGCIEYLAGHGGGQVWIKGGVYKPGGATNTDRSISFRLRRQVAIYGGFVGNETSLSQRQRIDPVSNSPSSTTLSGELNDPAKTADNSNHVFYNQFTTDYFSIPDTTAVLDGVVITGGYAGAPHSSTVMSPIDIREPTNCGGGMFSLGSPIIRNCLFTNNFSWYGGAFFVGDSYPTDDPQILNCVFDNNQALESGGAIYNYNCLFLSITNCVFRNNFASGDYGEGGGAIYNSSRFVVYPTYPKITSCLFEKNKAKYGGAIYNESYGGYPCSPFLIKCNFINNTASLYGGAIHNYSTTNGNTGGTEVNPVLINCLFQANSAGLGGAVSTLIGGGSYESDKNSYNPIYVNVCFQSNTASVSGGAIHIDYDGFGAQLQSKSSLTNCTFHDNSAPQGAAISSIESGLSTPEHVVHTLVNCVLFGNGGSNAIYADGATAPIITNSLLETSMTNYIPDPSNRTTSTTPFDSPNSGELKAPSDAINGGSNAAYGPPYALMVDLAGKPRFYNTTIDMGAYEYRGSLFCAPENVFVTPTGAGDFTGSSWENATKGAFLQRRLANSCPRSTFFLATGLYTPTSGADRSVSFILPDGVRVFGGYAGTGVNPNARTGFPNSTTLSGDIGQVGDPSDNSYHVVKILDGGDQTLLNGLVITGGLANGGGDDDEGGGLYIRGVGPSVVSSPRLVNVAVQGNQASRGGGLFSRISYAGLSSPSLVNVSFQTNSANQGGALYNNADWQGCKYCYYGFEYGVANITLTNVSISQNSATQGGGIYGPAQTTHLTNSIVWDNGGAKTFYANNLYIRYSLLDATVTGYYSVTGNLTTTQSPFVSATSLQLRVGSPATNSGNNLAYTTANGPTTDLAGSLRIQGGSIDRGAFELPPNLTPQLFAQPTSAYGNTPITVVIDITELNAVTTDGITTVRINKDSRLSLSLDPSLSAIGSRSVQNRWWSLNSSDLNYYILTTSQPIVGGDRLSVGLTGELRPGSTSGVLTVSGSVLTSVGESSLLNNTDSDKVDYFQQ